MIGHDPRRPGLGRAAARYPDLDLDRCKLVGWGAGNQLERVYPMLGIELEHTYCIDRANHGRRIAGLDVRPAHRLVEENPLTTLVIVFTNWWFDAFRQIAELGPYATIRAIADRENVGPPWGEDLELLGADLPPPSASRRRDFGLVVQGPVLPHVTRRVLATNRSRMPNAYQVLSTWEGTPPALLEACAPLVDRVVLSPPPPRPGKLNLLLQQTSTLAGLRALQERRLDHAIKTRTDQSLAGDLDLDAVAHAIAAPFEGASMPGLGRRILFDGSTSLRFAPYALSDQLMAGAVDDLLALWTFPEDIALGSDPSMTPEDSFVRFALLTPETTLVRAFLSRLGLPTPLSLGGYWTILDRWFGILPPRALRIFGWKAIPFSDLDLRAEAAGDRARVPLLAPADHAWAMDLNRRRAHHLDLATQIEGRGYTVKNVYQNRRIEVPAQASR